MSTPSPLKAAAAAKGLTLADVAREAGYSAGTVGQVSRGNVAPWPEFRRRMAEIFGFDPFAEPTPAALHLLGQRQEQGLPDRLTDPSAARSVADALTRSERQ